MPNQPTKLVLFDIDSTLITGARGHDEAYAIAFKKVYGVDASIHMINPHGMTDQQIIIAVMRTCGVADEEIEAKIGDCMAEMVRFFQAIQPKLSLTLLPGAKELLARLKAEGYLMGLVTGNLEPIAWGKMEIVGLREYFSLGGFGSDGRERSELAKKAIATARANCGLVPDARIYLIGDAPQDIQAGIAAGAMPIGVTTGVYSREALEEAGATTVIDNLTEAIKVRALF